MNDGAPHGRAVTTDRIVGAVVGEIAIRRANPRVFVLDEQGRPTVWPAGLRQDLPAGLDSLLGDYFAQAAARRSVLFEIVDLDGASVAVRIVPYRAGGADRYGLTVEPFATRAAR